MCQILITQAIYVRVHVELLVWKEKSRWPGVKVTASIMTLYTSPQTWITDTDEGDINFLVCCFGGIFSVLCSFILAFLVFNIVYHFLTVLSVELRDL